MTKEEKPIPEGLDAGVDYLWCPGCQLHVRCVRMDTGYWQVECPQCIGECAFCKCHLRELCLGVRPGTKVAVSPDRTLPDCPHSPGK